MSRRQSPPVPVPPAAARFVPRTRPFHKRYSVQTRQLVNVAAGRCTKPDDYVIVRYSGRIDKIARLAHDLMDDFEVVRRAYDCGEHMSGPIMKMRITVDKLRYEYTDFFRDSAWKIDDAVQERKNLSKAGYFDLEPLKDEILELPNQTPPDFDKITRMVQLQIESAETVLSHYRRTFPNARSIAESRHALIVQASPMRPADTAL
ncbi:unnamed protein product [Caenorhabditis sp. 36 PRJEB53466]|nr:unnamed protein product [Caenorhabditis sp. 36 PRJEB53466]